MRGSLLRAVLLAVFTILAQPKSAEGVIDDDDNHVIRCGTIDPPEQLISAPERKLEQITIATILQLQINTYFHVVESSATAGYVTQQMLDDQVGR